MSGPTTHDPLIYYAGDTLMLDVTCTDGAGDVMDLTGSAIEWTLEDNNGVSVATLTLGDGIEIATVPQTGIIEITLPAAATKLLGVGWYRDQLRVTTVDGIVSTQLVGLVEIKEPVGNRHLFEPPAVEAGAPVIGAPALVASP